MRLAVNASCALSRHAPLPAPPASLTLSLCRIMMLLLLLVRSLLLCLCVCCVYVCVDVLCVVCCVLCVCAGADCLACPARVATLGLLCVRACLRACTRLVVVFVAFSPSTSSFLFLVAGHAWPPAFLAVFHAALRSGVDPRARQRAGAAVSRSEWSARGGGGGGGRAGGCVIGGRVSVRVLVWVSSV